MYSTKITFTDYDGNEREKECFFHLNKAEVLEMQMSWDGGLDKILRRIIEEKDTKRIFEMFKMIVLKSYGEKSIDGMRFVKTPEVVENFTQTEAYSELIMKLATDSDFASEFINGIMPKNLLEEAQKLEEEQKTGETKAIAGPTPVENK